MSWANARLQTKKFQVVNRLLLALVDFLRLSEPFGTPHCIFILARHCRRSDGAPEPEIERTSVDQSPDMKMSEREIKKSPAAAAALTVDVRLKWSQNKMQKLDESRLQEEVDDWWWAEIMSQMDRVAVDNGALLNELNNKIDGFDSWSGMEDRVSRCRYLYNESLSASSPTQLTFLLSVYNVSLSPSSIEYLWEAP